MTADDHQININRKDAKVVKFFIVRMNKATRRVESFVGSKAASFFNWQTPDSTKKIFLCELCGLERSGR